MKITLYFVTSGGNIPHFASLAFTILGALHGKVPYEPIPLVLISTKLLEMYSIYKDKYINRTHLSQ